MTPSEKEQLRRAAEEMLAFDMQMQGVLPEVEFNQETPTRVSEPLSEKGAARLIAMVFKSSSEGDPHVVTRRDDYDGTPKVRCTCLANDDNPCWGIGEFKRVAGL